MKPKYNTWSVWTEDYEKEEYEVKLRSGEILICYPNANTMHSLDGSGRIFQPKDIELMRIKHEY